MSKLVDKERLARLAAALDARAKAAVAAEKERAMGVEEGLQGAIDLINNAETGILKSAQDYADQQVKALEDGQVNTNKEGVAANKAAIEAEVSRADAVEKELQAAIDLINNGNGKEGDELVKGLLDQAKDYTDQEVAAAATAQAAIDSAQNEKITANENSSKANAEAITELQGQIDALKGEGSEGTLAQVEAALKTFKEEQATKDSTQDELIEANENAAKAAQDDVDALEAIVGKAAEGEEAATGLFKEIEDAVKAEKDRAEGVESGFETRIAANEAFVAVQPAKDQAQDDRLDALEEFVNNHNDEERDGRIDALEEFVEGHSHEQIEKDIDALEEVVAKLDGEVTVEGSVKKQIADAIAEVNGDAEALEARVKANEDALAIVNGADTVEGSIAKAEKDAKDYADQQITALVDSAPEAMNTLNELAKAINDNQDVYDAYVEEHATAMATMKSDLQKEIDDDVKVVADELANQMNAEIEDSLANKIADEVSRAKGVEEGLRTDVDAKVAQTVYDQHLLDQDERDNAQEERLANLETLMGLGGEEGEKTALEVIREDIQAAQDAADAAQADVDAVELRVDALETKVGHDVEGENPATGLFLEVDEAKAAAQQAQNEVDAVEERMDAVEAEQLVQNQDIADNKAAIDKLNGGVDEEGSVAKAIADALEDYTDTEEMKAIIGRVVNSLALSMENNKMVLKLGGVDGIEIHSTELDMATDEDIDAIIAELDVVEGE